MANDEVKKEIEERIGKIVEFQREIETLSARALEELRKLSVLSQKLGEVKERIPEKPFEEETLEAEAEPEIMPEIEVEMPEGVAPGEIKADFENELARVKKIKDILEEPEAYGEQKGEIEFEKVRLEEAEKEEEISFELLEKEEAPEPAPTEKEIEEAIGEEPLPEKEIEKFPPEKRGEEPAGEEPAGEEPSPEFGKEPDIEESETMQTMFSGRWKKHWQEKPEPAAEEKPGTWEAETVAAPAPEEGETIPAEPAPEVKKEAEPPVSEVSPPGIGRRASDATALLERYKKTEPPEEGAEVFYYEHGGKQIVDSECLIKSMNRHLEECKNLYMKLAQTESPKEQFFVKQEIIQHQEGLRSVIEIISRLLEKENSSFPQSTINVVSSKVIKEMLENLSMQNWSNQDDFTFFDEYAKKIKAEFKAQMVSKVDYLRSIIQELGVI